MEKLKFHLNLSNITLGTMRFYDKSLSVREITNLIDEALSIGITTHHSSSEYSSYNLYLNALKKVNFKNNIQHIVKLSAPHFEDDFFSSKTLENRIDKELKLLNIETIDVLQWLLRSKPIDDKVRLKTLLENKEEIEYLFQHLKKKGKVKSVFSFPYSVPFAESVNKLNEIDGIISYLNKQELDYTKFAIEKPFIAIRPFFAGELLKKSTNVSETIQDCLAFTSKFENNLTTVVGINNIKQLEAFKG